MPAAAVRAEPRDAEEIFFKNEKSFGKSVPFERSDISPHKTYLSTIF